MGPRARGDGKEGRQSWRYAKSSSKATGSKKPYLVFLTLLLVGLGGLLFWAMWRSGYRNSHLAVIEVPANRRVATTPFARNDVQHLLDVKTLRTRDVWTDIRDNLDFADQVGPKAQTLLSKSYDNLILYINAPGISHAGNAYLTHSDYLTPGAASQGRHAVSDLLAKVADAGVGVKLLVLDSTSVDIDPRLGMVVNEFVRLVEAEVKKLDKDSNLFVLLPSGPFQVSRTSYGDWQSLFGKYLADGLTGAADRQGVGDGSGFVTLYELYEYVRAGCATSIDSRLGVEQTPVLLQAGIGYVPPSADLNTDQLRLTTSTRKVKPPAPEPAEATEEKEGETNGEEQGDKVAWRSLTAGRGPALALMQTATGAKEGSAEASNEPKEEPVAAKQPPDSNEANVAKSPSEKAEAGADLESESPPAEEAAPAKLTPQEQLLSLLETAWRLRDAIQDPTTHDVTPITFAPHLWRVLEAELLFVERQVLADPVFDQPDPATDEGEAQPVLPSAKNITSVEDLINTLTSLDAAISSGRSRRSSANDRSILTRLLKAWDQYAEMQLEAEEKFKLREAPEVVKLGNQARDFDLLAYSLPYYVRWHARAHQSLSNASSQHQRLDDYVKSTVRLATTLSSLRTMPQLNYSDEYRLEQVSTQLDQTLSLRIALDNDLWEDDDRGNPIIAERLLATPLLDAERRMQLVRGLVETKPDEPGDRTVPDARQDLSVTSQQWQRLHAHCELELRLVELALGVDHQSAKSLAAELAKAYELTNAEDSEVELWETYRSVGVQFAECFESLPSSILDSAARDFAVHIVDYRDVDDPRNSQLDERPPLQLHLKYEPEVKVEIAEAQNRTEFDLKLNENRQLVLTIRATREKDATEPLKIQVDGALLQVTRERPGPPEKKSGSYEQTIVYEVRAKPGVTQLPGRETTNVTVWSDASEQLDQRLTLAFTLPRPDQISLEVLRLSTRSQNVQQEQDSSLTLGVFPANLPEPQVTEFQLRAHNESGEPRTIRSELYLVKRGRNAERKHGAISKERRRKLFREPANSLDLNQLDLVAEAEVEVAVDESVVLPFKAPAASPPATPPPASAPAKPALPPKLKDAGQGIVCVLRDETGKSWVKWIEIEPTPLHRYVAADSWYESGRVVVEVTGQPDLDKHFPPDGLSLTWDTKPDFPDGTKRRIDGVILEPGDEHKARLYIDIEPDGITREVYIGVNGCPRVLSFRVPCRQSAERLDGEETRIERRSIAITKLSIPGTPQVFHIPTRPIAGSDNIYLDGPAPGAKPAKGEVFLERKQPVIIAMPVDALRVHFHLDAPVEGLRPDRGDAVELLIDGERQGIDYSDRYLRTCLLGIGDNGVVQLSMQMQEQFIDIKPRDRDEALILIGELTVDRRRPESSQAIPVIFDGTPPVIQKVVVPAQLDLESKQGVEVEADELSGISDVRYWFSVSRQQPVEKPLTAALLGPPVRRGDMIRLRFNVDTAGMDEGEYFLAIQVDDRVNLTSRVYQTPIRIKKKVKVPVLATISGTVQFSSVGDRLFTSVQLLTKEGKEVPGFPPQELMENRYVFKQVPAGEYIVRAELKKGGNTKKADKLVQVNKPGPLKADLSLK